MTSQTAREEELARAMWDCPNAISADHPEMTFGSGVVFARALLPIVARIEAEALARGRMEGAKAMQEWAAIHARCAFDDRPRRSGIDYQDGYDDATKAVAALIRAVDLAAIVKGLNDAD